MAFVRKKKIKGKEYYYLVRFSGGVQKFVKYLGKDIPEQYERLWKQGKKGRRLT